MIRCFNSLHSLCHVLGSMCSSIHVSYLMVGCSVLISYLCALYMLFTLWFLSWHLLFIFHPPVPWIQYIGYTPHLLFKTMCIITRNSKILYAQFEGEFILYVVIMRLICLQVLFCSLMECIWMSPRRYAYELISTSNSCLISYIC